MAQRIDVSLKSLFRHKGDGRVIERLATGPPRLSSIASVSSSRPRCSACKPGAFSRSKMVDSWTGAPRIEARTRSLRALRCNVGDCKTQSIPVAVWPENPIRRIPRSTKGYISVRNFRICEPASVPETPRIKQETPKSWTRRIPPARQPFMTDTSVAAVMTAWLDRAGEAGHCWFIQPATEISRKRNGSRHFDIGSSHYRPRQGLSLAVSDRSSFRAIRAASVAVHGAAQEYRAVRMESRRRCLYAARRSYRCWSPPTSGFRDNPSSLTLCVMFSYCLHGHPCR